MKIKGATQFVLLTCNHVIPTQQDAMDAYFYFGYFDDAEDPVPIEACSILDTYDDWFWSDPAYSDQVSKWGLIGALTLSVTIIKVLCNYYT